MTYSMTAFSRVQKEIASHLLCWEIRSVNHRYLDISFRLPEVFRFLEIPLRNALRSTLQRGKLECQLKWTMIDSHAQSMMINKGLVHTLLQVGSELEASYQLANDLTISNILAWPGVIEPDATQTEALSEPIQTLFVQALAELSTMRESEGNALKEFIKINLTDLNEEISQARKKAAALPLLAREKLLARLEDLKLTVSDGRVEQEIAMMLVRFDVREELDRLQAHAQEVAHTLEGEKAMGRHLDFLMQELNREANTLSSKSDSVPLTQHAVQMKVLIEQMREQVQNIE